MNDFYVILTASLVAINCSLMGSFLIMRKMVMIGDAISHAVLPGIFIAYMISGSAASLPILIGASVSGIVASVLIEWFTKKVRLQSDAAIGISYTFLFALGVILISKFGQNVDLDQQCVLYGELEYVSLSLSPVINGFMLPRQAIILGIVCLILLTAVWIVYYRTMINKQLRHQHNELKQEKAISDKLKREMNHRVKNHLQIVASTMKTQLREGEIKESKVAS